MKNSILALSLLMLLTGCADRLPPAAADEVQDTAAIQEFIKKDEARADIEYQYSLLLFSDSLLEHHQEFRKSIGAVTTACELSEHAEKWADLYFKTLGAASQINNNMIRDRFTQAVSKMGPNLLDLRGSFAVLEEDTTNPYLYTECLNGKTVLDQIDKALGWMEELDIDPSSIGLTSTAIRAKFAAVLGEEIRRDQRFASGGRWHGCQCESSIPFHYDMFDFSREELGLSETQWDQFMNGPTAPIR